MKIKFFPDEVYIISSDDEQEEAEASADPEVTNALTHPCCLRYTPDINA